MADAANEDPGGEYGNGEEEDGQEHSRHASVIARLAPIL
jgi:hypothetical protein